MSSPQTCCVTFVQEPQLLGPVSSTGPRRASAGALVVKPVSEGQAPKGLLASHLPCTLDLTGAGLRRGGGGGVPGRLSVSLFSTLGSV